MPRYHVEGQTSPVGARWQIWDSVDGHFARYKNIDNEQSAHTLCAKLNQDADQIAQLCKRIIDLANHGSRCGCQECEECRAGMAGLSKNTSLALADELFAELQRARDILRIKGVVITSVDNLLKKAAR